MDLEVVLRGALPPIVAALLLVTLAGVRLLPLAGMIGLFAAWVLLRRGEWPAWPHQLWREPDGRQWLLWTVLAAGLVASLEHWRVLSSRVAAACGLVVAAAAPWLMLQKQLPRWPAIDVFAYVGGGGLLAVVLALAGRVAAARAPGGIAPAVVWSTMLSLDAALIALSNSAFLAQLCGVVAAALGAAAGTALWRRNFALTAADGAWLGVVHALFVQAGIHLADLPWSAAGLMLLAPCLLLLLPRGAAKRPLPWAVAALVATLLPFGLAGWFAYAANPPGGY